METPILRLIFLYCVCVITFLISWSVVSIIQTVLFIFLKPFSVTLYRKINYYLLYVVYCQTMVHSTWFSKVEIYINIDKDDLKYLGKEHACIIMNHTYEIDFLFIGTLSDEMHVAGNFKPFIKKAVLYIPFVGWSMYISDYIMLERSFDKDKEVIQQLLADHMTYDDPVWTIFLPEGTRYTKSKHEKSLEYAKEKGLPLLKHHLTPRSKGFLTCLPIFRGKLGAFYDVLLSVNPKDEIKLTAMNVLLGKNIKAHLYVKRIPMEDVPEDEGQATEFLNQIFVEKDKVQEHFFNTGSYFPNSEAGNITKFKLRKNYAVLFVTLACMFLIVPPFWYYFIVTCFSTIKSAVYMSIGVLSIFVMFRKVLTFSEVKEK